MAPKRLIITLLLISVCSLAVGTFIGQTSSAQSANELSLPREWGKLAGFVGDCVMFEASDGTLRCVTFYSQKVQLHLVIKRD
jgi:hypothetical protein